MPTPTNVPICPRKVEVPLNSQTALSIFTDLRFGPENKCQKRNTIERKRPRFNTFIATGQRDETTNVRLCESVLTDRFEGDHQGDDAS